MKNIEIISREVIKPSFPTPSHLKTFSLSLIDQPIPQTFYIPVVLYYYSHNSNLTQSQVSNVLKTSLSNTLNLYYPLAGKMKGDAYVDCNDQGVNYLVARVDFPLSDIVESPRVEVLSQLIPSMTDETQEGASDVQLSIQCNLFNCGGIAIGILLSHRIGDACTLISFLQTWAKTARGEKNLVNPSFDSSSIFPPRDPSEFTTGRGVPINVFLTKRFVFSGQKIAALLEKLSLLAPSLSKPTRVELVTSLIWKCGMNANKNKGYTSSVATLPVNLRPRMNPPLPESSFGNIFRTAFGYGDFEKELDTLIEILRKSIGVFDGEGIKKFQSDGYRVIVETCEKVKKMIYSKEVVWLKFGVWCRFPLYEVDFGWGKPVWVSYCKSESKNETILLDSRCGRGIEAWVTMEEEDMKAFERDPELLAFALG